MRPSHLAIAVPPEQGEEQTALDLRPHYELRVATIDRRLELSEHWRDRIRLRPVPPRPASLAELVEAARRRLREDRLRDDRNELTARRFVLDRVIGGLPR
jgi:hypothetical protein